MGAVKKALPQVAMVPRKMPPFPQRPAYGQLGRPINLLANHFEIQVPSGDVYHYDVTVLSPSKQEAKVADEKKMRCLSTRINRLVIENLVAKYRGELSQCLPVFDGRKNLYTRRQLPFQERTFKVPFKEDEREQQFIVTIQYAATVNLDALHAVYGGRTRVVPQEVIQALDIIMRHGPCVTLTPVGRSIFSPPRPGDEPSIGGGHEVWFGYYTSVRPAQWKPMLNIDRSATAFYEAIPVLDFMVKLLSEGQREPLNLQGIRGLNHGQCTKLSKELATLRVKVLHLSYSRKYRVAKVTQLSAQQLEFSLDDGSKISVAAYFRQRYPKYMQYPHLPCIQTGTPARPVYLPLEACHIVEGQPYRKKLSENMTTNMIRRTAQPPQQRFQAIQRSVQDLVQRNKPFLDEFNIKVSTNPTALKGRVLDPPSLTFSQNKTLKPRDGVWDLRGSQLLRPMSMEHWALLSCGCRTRPEEENNLIHMFKQVGGSLGMRVSDPLARLSEDPTRTPIRRTLEGLKSRYPSLNLVVVLLGRGASYADIKEAAEVQLGIRTQCILQNNATRKCNAALVSNLCLKINAKLGGINNGLLPGDKPAIFARPLIIIGADVTHPAPGDRVKPSIAACVGSMDSVPSKYRAAVRVQIQREEAVARVEIIEDLQAMVVELLRAFHRETRQKPERIIFYRDGVSEGQFAYVQDMEVKAIRDACLELAKDGSYQPPITFIVVQKRHHTRFMPANEREGVGRCKNIPPGTTVDTVVTHPVDFDFFLCSHAGIQGTSKPAHYYVVHDDSDFTSDDLQKLSYYLCHTYARCARSVSIPAPVYYAHLAAFRAKEHITSACNVPSGSSVSSGGSDTVSTEQYVNAVRVTEQMQQVMYFV